MSKGIGDGPIHLNSLQDFWGGIPFVMQVQTDIVSSTFNLFPGGSPFGRVRVLGMRGIMTGAGAALDTVALQDGSGNVIIAAVNVSALSDKDVWDASTIDDLYWNINKGESLNVVTVSSALSFVTVELVRVELL